MVKQGFIQIICRKLLLVGHQSLIVAVEWTLSSGASPSLLLSHLLLLHHFFSDHATLLHASNLLVQETCANISLLAIVQSSRVLDSISHLGVVAIKTFLRAHLSLALAWLRSLLPVCGYQFLIAWLSWNMSTWRSGSIFNALLPWWELPLGGFGCRWMCDSRFLCTYSAADTFCLKIS